jgi:23S rRNA pseudouridine1911/1915/1917 synthase
MEVTVLLEDDNLVVIDKPYGVVVNKAESVKTETIQDWFSPKITESGEGEFFEKGGVVHRLDRDTSGVMVLARNMSAYTHLKQQFLERKTIKKYTALVHGEFKDKEGIISAPIERHPKNRHKFGIGTDLSRAAVTEWKVEKEFKSYTLLELSPRTGRTHQLRVHLQSINHPILSDPIYGWQKHVKEDLQICPRLFLHARLLEFIHPISGKKMTFESPLPQNLQDVLSGLVH